MKRPTKRCAIVGPSHCSVCLKSCGSSKMKGIYMQACSTRIPSVRLACSSSMRAQSIAQPKRMAVYPMGHPTSFARSWVLVSKGSGRSCLAAAPQDKEIVEASLAPKTRRVFTKAPKKDGMGQSEDELIRKELMLRLSMSPIQANGVVKSANCVGRSSSQLRLHNLRGWISTLVGFDLSIADVSVALRLNPQLIAYSSGGREESCIEVLRVMQQHGLSECQVQCVLRKFPVVLLYTPSTLEAKLLRLQELGFPPSEEKGLLERVPGILNSSLRWDTVKWLEGEGYDLDVARKMIKGNPMLVKYSPESSLSKTIDYYTWLLGSGEEARSTLAKYPTLFNLHQSSVHAKLAYLVDKLDINVVTMMKQNSRCVTYSMDARTGPRALLLRSLGEAASTKVYSEVWLKQTDAAFVQQSGLRGLWEGRCRDVFQGAADLEAGLELCKEQWVREEKSGWEEMQKAFQQQWVESGVRGFPQLRRDSSQL